MTKVNEEITFYLNKGLTFKSLENILKRFEIYFLFERQGLRGRHPKPTQDSLLIESNYKKKIPCSIISLNKNEINSTTVLKDLIEQYLKDSSLDKLAIPTKKEDLILPEIELQEVQNSEDQEGLGLKESPTSSLKEETKGPHIIDTENVGDSVSITENVGDSVSITENVGESLSIEDKEIPVEDNTNKTKTFILYDFCKNCSYVNLENIEEIYMGNVIIDISNGQERNATSLKVTKKYSRPFHYLNPIEIKRFYLYSALCEHLLSLPSNMFLIKTWGAGISCLRNTDQKGQSVFKDYKVFTRGNTAILEAIWKESKLMNSKLLFVGDNYKALKIYYYTEGLPTYKQLEETQAGRLVNKWINTIYKESPPREIDSLPFQLNFLKHMAMASSVSHEEFEINYCPSGVAYNNVFALLKPGNDSITPTPYTPQVFTGENIIKDAYRIPSFSRNQNGSEIFLNKETKIFLDNLCDNDTYKYSVIRGFTRRVLTAQNEGRSWQSGLWMWGPPNTQKTTYVEMLRKLLPPHTFKEFSRTQNQFTSDSLKYCRLLVVSDITYISKEQLQSLKRILGRDPLTSEIKHKQGTENIHPYCQVLMVSNHPPQKFPIIAQDKAIMDKLIILEFTLQSQIPTELQIPQIGFYLDPYLVDIVNWAAYAPMETIKQHIRAVTYQKYLLQEQGEEDLKGFPAFIMSKLWYSKRREDFLSIKILKNIISDYVQETGDDSVSLLDHTNKLMTSKELSIIFINYIKDVFNKDIEYTRFTKKIKVRPMGLTHIRVKDSNTTPVYCTEFKPEVSKEPIKMTEPFYTQQKVIWLEPSKENIHETQLKIKLKRKGFKPLTMEEIGASTKENSKKVKEPIVIQKDISEDPLLKEDIKSEGKKEAIISQQVEDIKSEGKKEEIISQQVEDLNTPQEAEIIPETEEYKNKETFLEEPFSSKENNNETVDQKILRQFSEM